MKRHATAQLEKQAPTPQNWNKGLAPRGMRTVESHRDFGVQALCQRHSPDHQDAQGAEAAANRVEKRILEELLAQASSL